MNTESQKPINQDGAILYKHLDSNLFSIATKDKDTGDVFVYSIEGNTGRVVHQFTEKRVSHEHPVLLLQIENVIELSFVRQTSLGVPQQQIQTVEIYQQQTEREQDVVSLLKTLWTTGATMDEKTGELPQIIQQSYVLPFFVKFMSVTRTA